MIGQTLSHYRLLEELDRRGIGIVYRAEDLRLGREVAVKVLPADLAGRGDALEQFQREARVASALNHPHICTVHDLGQHEGRPFIVMELLDGTSLKDLLTGQPLAPSVLVDLGAQIGEALGAAHQRGIVHRDVTPANVFVTREGLVKILDFGLAKLLHETRPDASVGSSTPTASRHGADPTGSGAKLDRASPYISPEQARGEALDDRSDLFSLGALLYEMATGKQAFAGRNPAEVFDKLLNRTPATPLSLNSALPIEIERVIEKALEKDPALRYQDAADLVADLRRAGRRLEPAADYQPVPVTRPATDAGARPALPSKQPRWTGRILAGAFAAALLLAGMLWMSSSAPTRPALTERDSVLLAGFSNRTGDAVFDETLRQGLAVQLSQSPFLDLVPEERITETLQLMGRSPGEPLASEVAREVCVRLGVKAMLAGTIARLGSLYVLSLDATNCGTGEAIAREQEEVESKELVLQGLGRITSRMRRKLGESLATLTKFDVPIERATTPSLDALRSYTLGIARRAKGAEIESIPFFERAVEQDPQFASAYTMLSTIYGNLGESQRGERYAQLAYDRRQRVSELERLFITYQYHDRVTEDQLRAIETLDVWKQSFPRDYRPVNALSLILARLGQFERAIEEGREAGRRNPAHPFPYSNLAHAYRGANRYAEARATAERAVALKIETLPTRRLLYQLATLDGNEQEAARHLAWGAGRPREFDLIGAQSQVLAYDGRMRAARAAFQRTIDMADADGFAETASGYAGMLAWTDAISGNTVEARAAADRYLVRSPAAVPRLRLAGALALAGATDRAQKLVEEITSSYRPTSTLIHSVYGPIAQAAVAIQRRQPDRAIELLRPTVPYELGFIAALAPPFFRGQAYLMKGQYEVAASEFRRVLEHRGVEPFSPLLPLAQLGLARALTPIDPVNGRRAYDDFFKLWTNADEDLAVLRAARAEYSRIW